MAKLQKLTFTTLFTFFISTSISSLGSEGFRETEKMGSSISEKISGIQLTHPSELEQLLQQTKPSSAQPRSTTPLSIRNITETKPSTLVSLEKPVEEIRKEEQEKLAGIQLASKQVETSAGREQPAAVKDALAKFSDLVFTFFNNLDKPRIIAQDISSKEFRKAARIFYEKMPRLEAAFNKGIEDFETGKLTSDQFAQGALATVAEVISSAHDLLALADPDNQMASEIAGQIREYIVEDLLTKVAELDTQLDLTGIKPEPGKDSLYDTLSRVALSLRPENEESLNLQSLQFPNRDGRMLQLKLFGT